MIVTSWSRDGRFVATCVNDRPDQPEYSLETLPPEGWSRGRALAIAPDSRRLATILLGPGGQRPIVIVPAEGGTVRELARFREPEVMLRGDWTRDGHSVVFIKERTLDGRSIEPDREL